MTEAKAWSGSIGRRDVSSVLTSFIASQIEFQLVEILFFPLVGNIVDGEVDDACLSNYD